MVGFRLSRSSASQPVPYSYDHSSAPELQEKELSVVVKYPSGWAA